MNIALTADWLPTFAGAEHVIAQFCRIWPQAPLYTTIANRGHIGPLDTAPIETSHLQLPYRLLRNHKFLLPWMPQAMERVDLRHYDVVLSSSHAVGKGILPPSSAKHICYCHTPMRYAWEMEDEYLDDFRVPKMFRKKLKAQLSRMRQWDLSTAKRVDRFIANSPETKGRIERIYGREAEVVYPPVEDRFFLGTENGPACRQGREQGTESEKEYFLAVGRLVPYKRFDLLIEAANTLKIPLKIAGKGDDFARLQKMAGPNVELLGFVPDEDMPGLYAHATALLFPQHEDAGVVPLEAQASGTPVIALAKGGALYTVDDGKTGLFFREQTVESLAEALKEFDQSEYDQSVISEHARQFSETRFRKRIEELLA